MTSSSTASVHRVRYWCRISRYDPAHRDDRGSYSNDTWTSISDVGKRFGGAELTSDEYLAAEDAYVDAFLAFAEDSETQQVQVRSLEAGTGVAEGDVLSVYDARELVRRMLREEVISRIEEPDGNFALHVGFDLYVYVGSRHRSVRAVERTRASGLHVDDDYPSPQLADEEQ